MHADFAGGFQSWAKEGTSMQRTTSLRTLVLMLELLVAVVSLQYMAGIRPAKASAVWLAGNCTTSPSAPAQDVNDALST
jgi:hypothetical protein